MFGFSVVRFCNADCAATIEVEPARLITVRSVVQAAITRTQVASWLLDRGRSCLFEEFMGVSFRDSSTREFVASFVRSDAREREFPNRRRQRDQSQDSKPNSASSDSPVDSLTASFGLVNALVDFCKLLWLTGNFLQPCESREPDCLLGALQNRLFF